jgi:CHRD domain
MRRRSIAAVLGVSALAAGGLAGAVVASAAESKKEEYTLSGTLRPNVEVPKAKGASGASGTFTGKLETGARPEVTWRLTFKGLTGPAMAAHIHVGKPGKAGPVAQLLCAPCKSPVVGKAHITKALAAKIEAGGTYVNVHTAKNAAGEIRTQVKSSEHG